MNKTGQNLTAEGRQKGADKTAAKSVAYYADILPLVQRLRSEGQTLQAIVNYLNQQGYKTLQGKSFSMTGVQIIRLLERANKGK